MILLSTTLVFVHVEQKQHGMLGLLGRIDSNRNGVANIYVKQPSEPDRIGEAKCSSSSTLARVEGVVLVLSANPGRCYPIYVLGCPCTRRSLWALSTVRPAYSILFKGT
jgi:hypothetical protein